MMVIKWGTGDGMEDPLDGPGEEDAINEPTSEVPDDTPRPADSLRSAWRRLRKAKEEQDRED
jgi:hypothetical protein